MRPFTLWPLLLTLVACSEKEAVRRDWAQCETEAERAFANVDGPRALLLEDSNVRHCMEARGYVWRTDTKDCRALQNNEFGSVEPTCFRKADLFSN